MLNKDTEINSKEVKDVWLINLLNALQSYISDNVVNGDSYFLDNINLTQDSRSYIDYKSSVKQPNFNTGDMISASVVYQWMKNLVANLACIRKIRENYYYGNNSNYILQRQTDIVAFLNKIVSAYPTKSNIGTYRTLSRNPSNSFSINDPSYTPIPVEGKLVENTDFFDLANFLNTMVANNIINPVMTYSAYNCHSNCHGNCHGRSRR